MDCETDTSGAKIRWSTSCAAACTFVSISIPGAAQYKGLLYTITVKRKKNQLHQPRELRVIFFKPNFVGAKTIGSDGQN